MRTARTIQLPPIADASCRESYLQKLKRNDLLRPDCLVLSTHEEKSIVVNRVIKMMHATLILGGTKLLSIL